MAAKYRKTKSGEWVVYGPATEISQHCNILVGKADGSFKTEYVAYVGKPFAVEGQQMIYGYLQAKETTTRAATTRHGWRYAGETRIRTGARRSTPCVTDGQCSSFGTGRSCGGYDCDGH